MESRTRMDRGITRILVRIGLPMVLELSHQALQLTGHPT
jgi:hypothetical protein